MAFILHDRSEISCRKLREHIPAPYKNVEFSVTFGARIAKCSTHSSVGKETRQTCHVERWNCTCRQSIARYTRKTLSFSNKAYFEVCLKKQFICRLNRIPESIWRGLMNQLAAPFHEADLLKIYFTDSFPVCCGISACRRCKIYQDECFLGYAFTLERIFYGLKMPESGIPVEVLLSYGSYFDVNARYDFSIPAGRVIF